MSRLPHEPSRGNGHRRGTTPTVASAVTPSNVGLSNREESYGSSRPPTIPVAKSSSPSPPAPKHPEYTAATTSTSANSAAAACTYDRSAIIDDGDITSSDAPSPSASQQSNPASNNPCGKSLTRHRSRGHRHRRAASNTGRRLLPSAPARLTWPKKTSGQYCAPPNTNSTCPSSASHCWACRCGHKTAVVGSLTVGSSRRRERKHRHHGLRCNSVGYRATAAAFV